MEKIHNLYQCWDPMHGTDTYLMWRSDGMIHWKEQRLLSQNRAVCPGSELPSYVSVGKSLKFFELEFCQV